MQAGERFFQKFISLFVIEVVILYLARCTFEVYKVGWVGADKVRRSITEQSLVGFGESGVSANYRVSADMPDVPRL